MKRLAPLLILILAIWVAGEVRLEASVAANNRSLTTGPQERVIDGPGETRGTNREMDLDESDFQSPDDSSPQGRKRIELFLGIAFLLAVILIAFFRRGSRSR